MASHRSIAERRALVAEWLESDLATAASAEICGVSPSSLQRWRGQIDADRETAPQASFVELVPAPGPAARETEVAAIV
jgi:transposase-like protein